MNLENDATINNHPSTLIQYLINAISLTSHKTLFISANKKVQSFPIISGNEPQTT